MFYCLMLRNLGRRLRNKSKIKVKWGILRGKGVYCLNIDNLGRILKNKTKIERKWGILR